MSKYVVLSGFLGSGKTTCMLAFAEYLSSKNKIAALLINDLGTKNLVDTAYSQAANCCCVDQITGDCICYKTPELADKLRRFKDTSHADVVFSDIPGCGIGALDHVYGKLSTEYPGEFELCPFVAVCDPERLRVIMPEKAGINLPSEMSYLFDAQLREAEVIILNKTDTVSDARKDEITAFLKSRYPDAEVFAMSAKSGEGVADAADYIISHKSACPVRDIGYGGELFIAAEKRMSWYNRKFFVDAGSAAFDGNAFIADLFENIRDRLKSAGRNVPHLKTFASSPDGKHAKASLVGIDYDIEFDERLDAEYTELRLILNARATCESEVLDFLMDASLKDVCREYGLACRVFFTECFGMMDEENE